MAKQAGSPIHRPGQPTKWRHKQGKAKAHFELEGNKVRAIMEFATEEAAKGFFEGLRAQFQEGGRVA